MKNSLPHFEAGYFLLPGRDSLRLPAGGSLPSTIAGSSTGQALRQAQDKLTCIAGSRPVQKRHFGSQGFALLAQCKNEKGPVFRAFLVFAPLRGLI